MDDRRWTRSVAEVRNGDVLQLANAVWRGHCNCRGRRAPPVKSTLGGIRLQCIRRVDFFHDLPYRHVRAVVYKEWVDVRVKIARGRPGSNTTLCTPARRITFP